MGIRSRRTLNIDLQISNMGLPGAARITLRKKLLCAGMQCGLYLLTFGPVAAESLDEINKQIERLGAQMQACGTNLNCLNSLSAKMQALSKKMQQIPVPGASPSGTGAAATTPSAGGAPPGITGIAGESPGLWPPRKGGAKTPGLDVEKLTQRLIDCGADENCWIAVQAAETRALRTRCDMFSLCPMLGSIDISIASAQARIAMDAGRTQGSIRIQATNPVPGARPYRAKHILDFWKAKLERSLPAPILDEVGRYAGGFPASSTKTSLPLVFTRSGSKNKVQLDLQPTRRDWAYALQGAMFVQAGFASEKHARLLDLAFWSFIRASQTTEEAEHLANVAFFLNLIRQYEDARDLLARARQLDPNHPDVRGNLAFAMRRLADDATADRELQAAAASDRVTEVTDPEEEGEGGRSVYGYDWGLEHFRLNRRHLIAHDRLFKAYQKASRLPLDQSDLETAEVIAGSPRDIYEKRLRANEAAYKRCIASVPPALTPCPFGSYILHPSCKGAPDRETARRSQLVNERESCKCSLRKAERDAKDLRNFTREQIDLARKFDGEWTPRLEKAVIRWRDDIRAVNRLYPDGTFNFPWPEQFYALLKSHQEELSWFANDWLESQRRYYEEKLSSIKSWRKKCAAAAGAVEKFDEVTFAFRPLRCMPLTGNTYSINLVFVKWDLFIPTSRHGSVAGRIAFDTPWGVSGEYWESAKGAAGGKFGVGYGPVSGEVWGSNTGDWGVGAGVNIAAKLNPAGRIAGKFDQLTKSLAKTAEGASELGQSLQEGIGNLFKMESKIESKYGSKTGGSLSVGPPKFESTVGFDSVKGRPPAWVRLRAKARSSDVWPLLGLPPGESPGAPAPDC